MEGLYKLNNVREILQRHGFSFSKKLGQNFLIDPSVCPKIAEMGGAKGGVGVIEVGTGVGVLTHELAKRADRVVAVELDTRLMPVLAETLAEHENVKIINDDIMKVDLHRIISEEMPGLEVVVCANLPYYITSPVIMRLFEDRLPISAVTVMVQKEAGVRLCAELGSRECGAVTFAVRYFSQPQLLFNVPRGCFYPSPNVDSCVVRFDMRKNPPEVCDEQFFFRVVKAAFSQRRKTLLNSLSSGLSLDKQTVSQAMAEVGLPPNIRPEAMGMEEMTRLADELWQIKLNQPD